MGCCDRTFVGTSDLSPLEEAGERKAFVSCSFGTVLGLLCTYDIIDSIEASNGRPLSDLRNFSRFGACPFCAAAMAASLLQAEGRGGAFA